MTSDAPDSTEPLTRADLEQLVLFTSADLDALEPVLRGCPVRRLVAGEVLIERGADNRQLFLVLAGELGIHLGTPETPALTRLGPGETVGELSLIDGKPASAFVIASRTTRLLVLDEELVWILAESSHAVSTNLLRTLASRMRAGNEIIQSDRAQMQRYKFHASVDALTGLFNRRWLDKMLARQMERSRAADQPLSLLLIDIDEFKQWNDQHGHVGGDCALRAVASAMRRVIRPTDLIARYGGEEFAVLLPGASLDNALVVGARVRSAVACTRIEYFDCRPLGTVTVSVGAAQMRDGLVPERFVEAADQALFRAKRAGRDRVEC